VLIIDTQDLMGHIYHTKEEKNLTEIFCLYFSELLVAFCVRSILRIINFN